MKAQKTETGSTTFFQRLMTSGSFASNVATLSLGTSIGQLSIILSAPLLARLFTAKDFGELQYILSIALILGGVSTLRYEMALPLVNSHRNAVNLLVLALGLAFITALCISLLFYLDLHVMKQFFKSITEHKLLFFIPIILLLEAANSTFSYWFTGVKNFKVPSVARSIFGIGSSTMQLSIAFMGLINGFGLLIGYVLGQFSSVVWYVYKFFRSGKGIAPGIVSISAIKEQARLHINFPLYSSWNMLLNTVARNLPPILLVSYFSVAEAGYFAIGIRLLNIPLNTLGTAVSQVYYQQIANYREIGKPMMPLLISTVVKLSVIIVIPLCLIFLWGEQLFGLVFGESWVIAGRLASIMVPYYFMRFISSPISTVFAVMGKQYLSLIWQAFYTLGTFASFYLTRNSMDFSRTIQIYSLTGASLFFILFLMIVTLTGKADKNLHLDLG
ncbi:MAG: oligosaccharide flippase family protein [Candidatus Marinimicrobia bacterium]|nr:oligosaccharide flippase family protein [Candidatus Neomarinimicrobiota bacterium]